MDLTSLKGNTYTITQKLGTTDEFNLYLCEFQGREYILKIAATMEHTGPLDREAVIIKDMAAEAERLETEYAHLHPGTKTVLNYQLCIPQLVESFICEQQGHRRINILGFEAAEKLFKLVPIGHITTRDRVRVDPRTGAWMLGKLLKILTFAHSQGIAIGRLTGDNVFVERDEHYIVVFDWTQAQLSTSGSVPEEVAREEISKAASLIITALGGDPTTEEIPADEQDQGGRYQAMVFALLRGGYASARKAHADFYTLVDQLWPRGFWKYRTYPVQ